MSRRTGKHRIYMNAGYDLSEQQLRDFFNQYGNVTDVYLPKHKSGRNKGFGFTTFDSEEGLRSALSAQEYLIGGDMVKITRAGPRPEHEIELEAEEAATSAVAEGDASSRQSQLFGKGPRLYVGGVPDELTEERLKAHFSLWGNVVDLYFPGKKGQSRVNYCFVTFDNWRAAQRACNQSERNIDGMPLQSINLAQERSAEQEQQAKAEAAALDSKVSVPPAYNFGAFGSAPNLALVQHLQLQAQLQAQAQQLGAMGYHAQPQLLPNTQAITPGADPSGVAASLASYPEAYQQLLSNMLTQQSRAAAGSSGVSAVPAAAAAQHVKSLNINPYALSAGSGHTSAQYLPGMSSMPMDLSYMLAAQAAAANHEHMPDAHRLPQPAPTHYDGPAGAPILHNSLLKPPSAVGLAAGMPPSIWGWGAASVGDMQQLDPAPGFNSHADYLGAQAQGVHGASALQPGGAGDMQMSFGVLNLTGFGPLRSNFGRPHNKSYMPY